MTGFSRTAVLNSGIAGDLFEKGPQKWFDFLVRCASCHAFRRQKNDSKVPGATTTRVVLPSVAAVVLCVLPKGYCFRPRSEVNKAIYREQMCELCSCWDFREPLLLFLFCWNALSLELNRLFDQFLKILYYRISILP